VGWDSRTSRVLRCEREAAPRYWRHALPPVEPRER
jgi:hypothetical protein